MTTRQRVGLALAFALSAANIASIASPTPEGETGPPFVVLAVSSLLGLVGVVGSVLAWRSGNRKVLRVVAGAVVVMALLATPAFFVSVPAAVKALVGVTVLLTIAAVVLMLSARQDAPSAEAGS